MQSLLDNLTKPKGSLGTLEAVALKLAAVQNRVPPSAEKRGVWVFAGDHGVVAEGVSLYPQEVTPQMFANIAAGGAAINVLSRHCGFDVQLVDAGMTADVEHADAVALKAGSGTRSMLREEAMTADQLRQCLANGRALAKAAADDGFQLVAVGDMGIGNTTAAAALVVAAGLDLDAVVDRGTGIDDETLRHKRSVIADAVEKHGPYESPEHIMRCVGGLELATMTGFILGLKGAGIGCLIDGFPVTAAAYMAWQIDPSCGAYLFAGHLSKVKGHRAILSAMGLEPLVSLDMRLGEGTGAVIGGFLVYLSTKIASEMATFDSADVSRAEDDETDY